MRAPQKIPVAAIIGTVEATADAHFRPATDRVAHRWQMVALAHRHGHPPPPIAVIEQPDGYYILDVATAYRSPASSATETSTPGRDRSLR